MGVFGDVNNKQWEIAIWIFIVTTIIIIISYFVVGKLTKNNKSVNQEITLDELEELDIEVDIMSISKDEIDEIEENNEKAFVDSLFPDN